MTLIKINPDDVESFTIVTNPFRTYVSSSQGVTGSVHVFARRSNIEKETTPSPAFIDATHSDSDINTALRQCQQTGRFAGSDPDVALKFPAMLADYLTQVDAQQVSSRKQKTLDIIRYIPGVDLTSNMMKKSVVKDILMPYYRT